jgi:hypothetical protein
MAIGTMILKSLVDTGHPCGILHKNRTVPIMLIANMPVLRLGETRAIVEL